MPNQQSDNNCNFNNEILFWKVIHNKYLFQYIFHQIHTIEWIQYDNVKSYHIGNRIKFKHINNLNWMIERDLFELVKCKLEAGEYIEIERSIFSTSTSSSPTTTQPPTTTATKQSTIFKTTNRQIEKYKNNPKQLSKRMKEVFQLLLKFNCFILQGIDIMNLAIVYQNNKLIKILSTSPYTATSIPITIYPSRLKWLIEKTKNVDTLDLIINSPSNIKTIISTQLKNTSISIATNNSSQCKEELILLLLDNQKYYTLPTQDTNTVVIEPIQFYQLKSIKLLNKLVELHYYTPQVNQMADQNRIREIISSIWISKSKLEYTSLLDSISTELQTTTTFKNKLPTCWNDCMSELFNRVIIIKNTDIVDWILENIEIEKFKSIYLSNKKTIFKFDQSHLINYAHDKFKSNSILQFTIEKCHFKYPFIKAISNCDIQELQFINSSCPSFCLTDDHLLTNFTFFNLTNQSSTNIIKLVTYLNTLHFSNFDTFIFKSFINSLLDISQDTNTQFKISDLDINFEYINIQSAKEITNDLVCSFLPDAIKLVFKNPQSNYIKLYPTWFEREFQLFYDDDMYSNKRIVKPSDKVTVECIMQCIELILLQFNIESTNQSNITYLSVLQDIINLQFKTLFHLNNQVIPIDRLKYIYKLIDGNEYSIQLNQTLFHLTSYLGCKSMKLFKYIRGLIVALNCNIKSISDTSDNHESSFNGSNGSGSSGNNRSGGYDIKKYLNFQVFTFDYIFGDSTFNEIIDKLVLAVSHLPALDLQMVKTLNEPSSISNNINNNMEEYEYDYDEFEYRSPKDYYFESFNFNLEYFLKIHRSDLFFKEMDFIMGFLESTSTSTFKLSDQVIIYASGSFDTEQFSKFIQNQLVVQFIIELHKNVDLSIGMYLLNHAIVINEILIQHSINTIEYWSSYLNRVGNKVHKDSIVLKYKHLFLNCNDANNLIPIQQLYSIDKDKCSNYNIQLRNLILSVNPQHHLFRFTNSTIDYAIKEEKIEFLKYYYENTTIIKQDTQLLNHLKYQLSIHPDYKYVNWL